MDAVKAVGDARATMGGFNGRSFVVQVIILPYTDEVVKAKEMWDKELERLGGIAYTGDFLSL